MCLALPARIVAIDQHGFATADLGGVKKRVSLALLDDVAIDDYVILHVGYALARLDRSEAEATLQLFADLAASQLAEI